MLVRLICILPAEKTFLRSRRSERAHVRELRLEQCVALRQFEEGEIAVLWAARPCS